MDETINLKVHLAYDAEAAVWYVAESDIPGLHLEAADAPDLMRKIAGAAAELIALNEDEIRSRSHRIGRPPVGITPIFDNFMPVTALA